MLLGVLLAITLGGCERTGSTTEAIEPVVEFGRGRVRIETATDTFHLGVEVAETDQQRQMGLMRRSSLAADSGMIFLFQQQQPPEGVFWMYNTLVPLSIAFIGADGRIGSIRDMEPCPSPYPQWCPNYEARVPYMTALEVNRGWFAERRITVGDRVVFERTGIP